MIEFRTKAQIRRAEKDEVIRVAFTRFKQDYGYADCRIIKAMADSREYPYTSFNAIALSLRRSGTIGTARQ